MVNFVVIFTIRIGVMSGSIILTLALFLNIQKMCSCFDTVYCLIWKNIFAIKMYVILTVQILFAIHRLIQQIALLLILYTNLLTKCSSLWDKNRGLNILELPLWRIFTFVFTNELVLNFIIRFTELLSGVICATISNLSHLDLFNKCL